ncbi:pyruvate formate lyase family protein, partial [Candidatus Latescibacterota bacterium]
RQFYGCVEIVLQGLLVWVDRHVSALADEALAAADPERRGELEEMAAVCARVPRHPATTFREAVQAFWFQHLAVMFENPFGGNGPGRLDYYLWPYLEADLAAGRITMAAAGELMTELLIALHERIAPHDGWVEALPVGGRMRDGTSAINPLSYMIIELMIELEQTHPSVYVRLHDDAPEDFVNLTARYLIAGRNRAQVYGDDAVIRALHTDGVALEDARHWTAGGCMEVSPQGCNCDLLFAFAHNVARTFELVINGGCLLQTGERAIDHHKTLADYGSFEELYADFATELEREVRILLRRLDIWLECYAEFRPSFLMSSMTHDCLERGRTINDGGARYTDYGGSGVGIPNVGDSLYAIKRTVFDEGRFTGGELLEAMRADFAGHEQVRAFVRSLPRYGSDSEEVDALVDRVLVSFSDILHTHRNPHGGRCRPIILGFVWVVSHGEQVGAMADGRRSGQPLAHGLSPQSGAAVKGVSAAISSATRLSLERASGGGAMMWDLDEAWATPEVVKALLKTFIAGGGHIFQGNVMSVDRLLEAQSNPEDHPDLLVRVGGYSARFAALSEATQNEIIQRHRYCG